MGTLKQTGYSLQRAPQGVESRPEPARVESEGVRAEVDDPVAELLQVGENGALIAEDGLEVDDPGREAVEADAVQNPVVIALGIDDQEVGVRVAGVRRNEFVEPEGGDLDGPADPVEIQAELPEVLRERLRVER